MRYVSEFVAHEVYAGSGTDVHGNEVESWAAPTQLGIYAFNPGGTSEPLIPGYDRVVTKPTIYFPEESVVGAHDRITRLGTRYEVDGDTLLFRNPYDPNMDGNVANLKAVTG